MAVLIDRSDIGHQHAASRRHDRLGEPQPATEATQQRTLVQPVANLEEIRLAAVALEDVHVGDVEHNPLAVGGRDPPLALLSSGRRR